MWRCLLIIAAACIFIGSIQHQHIAILAKGGSETKCIGYSTNCASLGTPGTIFTNDGDVAWLRDSWTATENGTMQSMYVWTDDVVTATNAWAVVYKQNGTDWDVLASQSFSATASAGWDEVSLSGSFSTNDVLRIAVVLDGGVGYELGRDEDVGSYFKETGSWSAPPDPIANSGLTEYSPRNGGFVLKYTN